MDGVAKACPGQVCNLRHQRCQPYQPPPPPPPPPPPEYPPLLPPELPELPPKPEELPGRVAADEIAELTLLENCEPRPPDENPYNRGPTYHRGV